MCRTGSLYRIGLRLSDLLWLTATSLLLLSCSKQPEKLFVWNQNSGIEFNNALQPTPKLNILTYLYYYNGGGVAAGDLNNDGLIDLYFTGNQISDRLYLNAGDLHFRDITDLSGIDNKDGWTTGVTLVDINHDGLLDIYVCKIGRYLDIEGRNLLYVNQGNTDENIPRFKESASEYGLDIQSFSTQSAFFDYDLDGDLDMYLMNYSVFPNRTYGHGDLRKERDTLAGDMLFRNDDGKFVEIGQEAGIFQGKIGYGLGLGTSDLNNDGYPDVYIGNDFFENDYLYLNNRNGTFREIITEDETRVGHTSHFSMGNDISDINNDGWTDILSLDMLPEQLEAYKTSAGEYNNPIYDQYLKNGYRPQYMQNALLLNEEGSHFHEAAHVSGLAATDWSWAPLIADLDNDGFKDVYISNGILGATNDMDFINYIANKKIQEQISSGMEDQGQKFTETLPQRKLPNYFFRNEGGLFFRDHTFLWFEKIPSFSNGAIYADLDNDGDLDLVINNVNEKAFLLENKSEKGQGKSLKVRFRGSGKNTFGIGAKVGIFADSLQIHQENFTTRGYLSAVAPEMTIGIGPRSHIDSLLVIWPGGSHQMLRNIPAGEALVLDQSEALETPYANGKLLTGPVEAVPSRIDFRHSEMVSYEFGREPLIPYAKGSEGPSVAVGDVNSDGIDDLYIGGGRKQAGALFLQQADGSFLETEQEAFRATQELEETDCALFDADNDGDSDLIIVSGGNEITSGPPLMPVLYLNDNGVFQASITFPALQINASVVRPVDLDRDGDLDLVLGANAVPQKFGADGRNLILINDGKGNFSDQTDIISQDFAACGLVEDIEVTDLNDDGYPDLVVVGHWSPVRVFQNTGTTLVLASGNGLERSNGLWNSIVASDFDRDGDIDLVAGNWGNNSRLRASEKEPMRLYMVDFDNNGKEEALVTYFQQGRETVFSTKEELSKQIPSINKRFLLHADFAKAEFKHLFDEKVLLQAQVKQVYELASCYFENDGTGTFKRIALPYQAQLSSLKTLYAYDFNMDGYPDLVGGGNDYAISTQLGRLDASHGLLLLKDPGGSFIAESGGSPNIPGLVRDIDLITVEGRTHLIVARNNETPVLLQINK